MFHKTDKVFFGIALASIMVLGGFSFSNNLLPEVDAAAYAKYDGIDGEATDKEHVGWSEVLSFSFGVEREVSSSTGARTASSPSFSDFTMVKSIDKSSPKLFLASATGSAIKSLNFEMTRGDGSAYLKYELTNVMVTSYNIGGSGQGDNVPTENFSLNFEEIKVTYTERDSEGKSKGKVEYTWKGEEGEA